MKNIPSEWFIRDQVATNIDSSIQDIAKHILDWNIDDSDPDALMEVSAQYFDTSDMTGDEMAYFLEWLQLHCAIEEACRAGVIASVNDMLELVISEEMN